MSNQKKKPWWKDKLADFVAYEKYPELVGLIFRVEQEAYDRGAEEATFACNKALAELKK